MTPAEKVCLISAIALIVFGIFMGWFQYQTTKPLTDYDERCSRIDEELDELWARDQVRPYGSVERGL